jgi:hypothetical protein
VIVTTWNDINNAHEVETTHGHVSRWANALDIIEDAAREAYIYYRGRRFGAMKEDHFRFLPCNDPKGTWVVLAPLAADLTLDIIVRHVHAMKEADGALKEELCNAQKSKKHFQKQVEAMQSQLGQPPIHKKA